MSMSSGGTLSRIVRELDEWGIGPLDDRRTELMRIFVREVVLWSGRIHLVGKRSIRKTISDLVVDSWLLHRFAAERGTLKSAAGDGGAGGASRVADVGSGAGFPGIVWKIAQPELDISLFERREKAVRFLERVVTLMKLDGFRVRGGEAQKAHAEERFDVVVSKAAGQFPLLAPVVTRLLHEGGAYVTVKGGGWEREEEAAGATRLKLAAHKRLVTGRGTMLLFVRDKDR